MGESTTHERHLLTCAIWPFILCHMPIMGKPSLMTQTYTALPLTSSVQYAVILGLSPSDSLDLISSVNKGLRFSAFERLQEAIDLSAQELAKVVSIPTRTLHRRKEQGRLQPDESDRLVRLSRVYGKTLELFEGNKLEARHWLSSPQSALGGTSPLSMASTEVGAREVEALIGRLEYGVFS